MGETGELKAANDATVNGACLGCGGAVVARSGPRSAWLYCPSCHSLSRSVLVPAPAGGSVLVHSLAAA